VLVHRSPNVILTNWHVVQDAKVNAAKDRIANVYFPDRDEKNRVITRLDHYLKNDKHLRLDGKVIQYDPERDIAMVQVEQAPDTANAIPLAAESAQSLERVFGIGQSGVDYDALWQSNAGDCRQVVPNFSFRKGSGSVTRMLLTSQPINHGDSGGPVVNSRLELVGIVCAKAGKYLELLEKSKGVRVEGMDNMSMIIDVEEARAHLNTGFRMAFKSTFVNPASVFASGPAGRKEIKRRSVDTLIKVLQTGTPQQVALAMTEITEHGAAAVPQLIAMLETIEQRGNWPKVLEALVLIGTPANAAVDAAIRCLGDDYNKTRIAAARFLGCLPEGKKGLPELWKAVGSTDLILRQAAKASILFHGPYNQGHRELLKGLAGIPKNQNPFVKAFYVELILTNMRDMSAGELSQQILQKDINLFESSDQRLRATIAELIRDHPDRFTRSDTFKCLIPLLGDEEPVVQKLALKILDEKLTWNDEPQMSMIIKETKDGKQTGKQIVIEPTKGWESVWAKFAWGKTLSDPKTDKVYLDEKGKYLLFDRIRNTKQEDVDVLLQYINKNTPADGVIWVMQLIERMDGKGQVDFEKIKDYLDTEKFPNIKVQLATLAMVHRQKKPIDTILDELVKLSKHQHRDVRGWAILSLAIVEKENTAILKVFLDGLEDADSDIRDAAKLSLSFCLSRLNRFAGDADLKLARETLVQAKQPDARMMAAHVLANTRGKAASAAQELVRALDDPDIEVRASAVQALGYIGSDATPGVEKIGQLLLHDLDVDETKRQALNKDWDDVVLLKKALDEANRRTAKNDVESLGRALDVARSHAQEK
jgi:HEAT repeat protein